jgi:hypothetical protein
MPFILRSERLTGGVESSSPLGLCPCGSSAAKADAGRRPGHRPGCCGRRRWRRGPERRGLAASDGLVGYRLSPWSSSPSRSTRSSVRVRHAACFCPCSSRTGGPRRGSSRRSTSGGTPGRPGRRSRARSRLCPRPSGRSRARRPRGRLAGLGGVGDAVGVGPSLDVARALGAAPFVGANRSVGGDLRRLGDAKPLEHGSCG